MTWSDISRTFEALERRLVASLARNLRRHRDWEKEEGFAWPAWQAQKLHEIEAYRKENRRIMEDYAEQIDAQTRVLMEEQFAEGYAHEEQVLSETLRPANPSMQSFFGVNDRRMDRLIEDMLSIEQKAESAALRMMDDTYRDVVAKTAMQMATGAVTLPQALDIAMQDFLRAGINCIEYRNGRRVNIADYAQMALRTAATRAYLQGEAKKRAALLIDTVLVSQYGACSQTCLPWQGRVYIDDVFGQFLGEKSGVRAKSQNGNWYPLLSEAVAGGLFHPNCRHTLSTWIEGVSTLPPPMDAKKIRTVSALEQQQRRLERRVREAKRIKAGMSDPQNQKRAAKLLSDRQRELREFIKQHEDVLRRDYWREKVYPTALPLNEGEKHDILSLYKPASAYLDADGVFDLTGVKSDFKEIVKTMPEQSRMYFDYIGDDGDNPTAFEKTDRPDLEFAYNPKKDLIYYNPAAREFSKVDPMVTMAHEESHRLDYLFFSSWESSELTAAIHEAQEQVMSEPELFRKRAQADEVGCFSDIISALSAGEIDDIIGHDRDYWKLPRTRECEVFANLFTLVSFQMESELAFLKDRFPELIRIFMELVGF